MSTAIVTTTATTAGSLDNVGRAFMNWLRALLNAKPAALAAAQGCKSQALPEVPSYYKVGYRMELLRRARELDALSPNETADLRKQAAAI